jgi:uncharacterized protein involved in outer membrane biogenesis
LGEPAIKTFLYLGLGLLALLIAAVVIAPFAVDLNDYKGAISAVVKEQTGRDLAIDGTIDLSLLPMPTIKIGGVRFANLEGAAAPDMLRVATVEASIALAPLLRGEIEIHSLTIVDPVIELETLADGRANWQLALSAGSEPGGSGSGAMAVRIDSLQIENATLIYRDSAGGRLEKIEALYMDAAMDSINGPYRAQGRFTAQSNGAKALPLTFEIGIDRLDRRPLPLRAVVKLTKGDASVSFTGSASSATADAELSGKLKFESASLARILNALGGVQAGALLDQPLSATAALTATMTAVGINDIRFDFGGIKGSGAVSATLGQDPQIDVAIALNRVDLDALMAKAPDSGAAPDPEAAAAPFSLPGGVYATLDLRIDALVYKQAVVRQAQFVAALDQGALTLQQASALLPGGSDITVFGVLESLNGKPNFSGQIEASSDNLRAVLDWLDVAYPNVPADRLRKFSLSTKLEVTPSLAKISAIDLRVDLSRLSGGVNLGLGARPAFNAIVTVDKINLDAYLPASTEEPGDDGNPFAALGAFDGEIKARIGSIVYKTSTISGIALDAGVRGGTLTLRSLAIGDLAGANGTIAGVIDSAKPSFDLTYDLGTSDLARLFQLAGMTPPKFDLGAVTAEGRVTGDMAGVTLDSRITMAGGEARLTGALSGLMGAPSIDAEIALDSDNLRDLAARFGTTLSAKAHGPFSLRGTVKGNMAAATVNLTLAALGADARLDGSIKDLFESPAYDLNLVVSHPDFVSLAESLVDGLRFTERELGEVRLRARIVGDGNQALIDGIDALLGPSQIAGAVTARFDGERPRFDADLTTGEFQADMFLAAVVQGSGGNGTGGNGTGGEGVERWSREPMDLTGLKSFDLKMRIASQALSFRKYRFEDVTLRVNQADGVLDVEELSGRLYGAPTMISARLAATIPPTLSATVSLQGADMRALLRNAAEIDAISGLLDLSGQFNSRGNSEFELISALQGTATVAARDGSIEGIDLGRLNTRLANIDSEFDLGALIVNALSGGTTAIKSLDGSFTVNGGVLRSDDLRAVLEGGEGHATLSMDLPRWQLAMNSEFRLTGHPKAPPVGLLLMGPIDNPEREIRDQALREYIAAKFIGVGVRKLIPALTGEDPAAGILGGVLGGALGAITGGGAQATPEPAPEPTPAEEAPPPEPAPKKLFENLLERLIQGVGN